MKPHLSIGRSGLAFFGLLAVFLIALSSCNTSTQGKVASDFEYLEVAGHVPKDKTTGVKVDAAIEIHMSRSLNEDSIKASYLLLERGVNQVPRKISYNSAVIRIKPKSDLLYSTKYTVTVKPGLLSKSDREMEEAYSFSFTTEGVPLFESTMPKNNAVRVSASTNVTIVFPKPIDEATLSSESFYLKSSGNIISANLSATNSKTIVLDPIGSLQPDTLYTATITTDLQYATGDSYPKNHSISFKTAPSPWKGIKQFGSASTEMGFGVDLDSEDNVYIVGYGEGDIDDEVSDGKDVLFSKYSPSGAKLFVKLLGTSGSSSTHEEGKGIVVDSEDGIYITGYTEGTLNSDSNLGGKDVFLVKLDADGTTVWSKQLGTSNDEEGLSTTYYENLELTDNFIYVTGYTSGDLESNTNQGMKDIFLAKYNSSGLKLWVKTLGTINDDVAKDVAVNADGDVFITGYTEGDLDSNTAVGGRDIFLAKFDKSGTKQWTKLLGTTDDEEGYSLACNANGDIFVTGYTKDTLPKGNDLAYENFLNQHGDPNPSPGTKDIFVVKFDATGDHRWTKHQGGTGTENEEGRGLVFDATGDMYLVGYTESDLSDFDDDNSSADANGNIFFSRYLAAEPYRFNVRATRQVGTDLEDGGWGIALDSIYEIFITGNTKGTLGATNQLEGVDDIFILKADNEGAPY